MKTKNQGKDISNVIDKIKLLIPDSFSGKSGLITDLDSYQSSASYSSPEGISQLWLKLSLRLTELLGAADNDWKKQITSIMMGDPKPPKEIEEEPKEEPKEDSTPRQYSLVRLRKWYKEFVKENNHPIGKPEVFIYFGEIPNMPGHCVTMDHRSGKFFSGFHIENFEEVPDDDM